MSRLTEETYQRLMRKARRSPAERSLLVGENQLRQKERDERMFAEYDRQLAAIRAKYGGPIEFHINPTSHGRVGRVEFWPAVHGKWVVESPWEDKPRVFRSQAAALREACKIWREHRR